MDARRLVALALAAGVLVGGACSSDRENAGLDGTEDTSAASSTSTGGLPALSAPPTATTTPPTTARPRRTTKPKKRRTTTTTTTLVPVRSAHNPRCVVRIRDGDSLFAIAEAAGNPAVTILTLQRENRIRNPDRIDVGDLLDICVRNKINDINGKKREPPARQPRRNRGSD